MLNKIGQYFFGGKKNNEPPVAQLEAEYAAVISRHISYFNELPEEIKKRFLQRSIHFCSIKEFSFIGMKEKKEIPILVSAAAVQITLGLEKYELPFFKNIYITPDAYLYKNRPEYYVGHVSPSGIYLSWKYFLQGYENSSDNINVALHELAHALAHEHFMDDAGVEPGFKRDFEKFHAAWSPALGKPVTKSSAYLREYAYTNIQEFWAVSVEAFFENPAGLKRQMPELYGILCDVLNQDPLTIHKILKE